MPAVQARARLVRQLLAFLFESDAESERSVRRPDTRPPTARSNKGRGSQMVSRIRRPAFTLALRATVRPSKPAYQYLTGVFMSSPACDGFSSSGERTSRRLGAG